LREGGAGDLYIQIHLKHHSHFERQGADLLYNCRVSVAQAALGGEVPVHTIDGPKMTIRLPAGIQYGKVLRIHEKGMPSPGGKRRGDLLVNIHVDVPTDLTPRQKELFEELAKTFGHEELPKQEEEKGFFRKILG